MKEATIIELYMQPIQKLNIANRNINFPVPLHMHNFYEVELVLEGQGTNIINGISFPLSRGLLYLLSPSDTHQIECIGSMSLIHAGFLPDPENGLSVPLPDEGHIIQLSEEELAPLLRFFSIAQAECGSQAAYRIQSAYAALSLILIYLLRNGKKCTASSTFQRLQPALMYIWQHCSDESLDLNTVAESCGLSPAYFSSVFHKTVGQSFTSYLIECRLRCACYLLSETDMSITNIVYECGFSSPSRFFRVFKGRFGCSPGEYRTKPVHGEQQMDDEHIPTSLWRHGEHIINAKVDTK